MKNPNKIKTNIQENENDLETEQKIKKEEQINEIKFKLFLYYIMNEIIMMNLKN